jgi:hypothetical protein
VKITHLTFEQWCKWNPDAVKAAEDDCSACDGTGVYSCECDGPHGCRKCQSKGKVSTAFEVYADQCKADEKKFRESSKQKERTA